MNINAWHYILTCTHTQQQQEKQILKYEENPTILWIKVLPNVFSSK